MMNTGLPKERFVWNQTEDCGISAFRILRLLGGSWLALLKQYMRTRTTLLQWSSFYKLTAQG